MKREKRDRSRCRLKGLIVLRDRDHGGRVSGTWSPIGIADPCAERDNVEAEVHRGLGIGMP